MTNRDAVDAAEPDAHILTDRDAERFIHTVRAGAEVRRRSQFFLWAQGQLQSLLPHEVLICAFGDPRGRSFRVEPFSSYPLPVQDEESLKDAEGGLMSVAARAWGESGERPLVVCGTRRDSPHFRRFEPVLFRYAFPNLLAHGMPVLPGAPMSFFLMANIPQPVSLRTGYLLELLVPHIHAAFTRVLAGETEPEGRPRAADALITAREMEILRWVRDGKSNQEIGDILGISPLTVKNHVQKILKKLNVQNRAQAVAKGIALQLIKVSSQ